MKTMENKIKEILDEYASIVDDDTTYFVKPEVRKKYIDQLLSLFTSSMEEVIGEDIEGESIDNVFYEEVFAQNKLRADQRARLKKLMGDL